MSRFHSVVALLLICSSAASAQGGDSLQASPASMDLGEEVTFEVTPHTGLMGGSGVFGLRLGMNYAAVHIEIAGEQVIGRTANMYPLALNALVNLSTRGRLIPYGAVGGGLLLTVPTTTIGDRTVSTLGVNFGGGVRYFLTETFGVRVEVKQHMTSVENGQDAGTTILMFQELTLGVTFRFR